MDKEVHLHVSLFLSRRGWQARVVQIIGACAVESCTCDTGMGKQTETQEVSFYQFLDEFK